MGFKAEDFISIYQKQIPLSETESVAVSENVNLYRKQLFINKYEVIVEVQENVSRYTKQKFINVSDSVGFVDDSTQSVVASGLNLSLTEAVALAENIVVYLGQRFVNVNDSVALTELLSQYLKQQFINVSDSVSVTEEVTLLLPSSTTISVSDAVSFTESITTYLKQHFIFPVEAITVVEAVTIYLKQQRISVSDSVGVSENVSVSKSLAGVLINVTDSFGISESISSRFSKLNISTSDTVRLRENHNREFDTHGVVVATGWMAYKGEGPWEFDIIANKWGYLNNPEWMTPPGDPVNYDGREDEEPIIWNLDRNV